MVLTDGIYGTRGAALYEDRVGRLVGRRCGLGWWLSGMLVQLLVWLGVAVGVVVRPGTLQHVLRLIRMEWNCGNEWRELQD